MEPSLDTSSTSATSLAPRPSGSRSSAPASSPCGADPRPAPRLSFRRFLGYVPGLLRDRAEAIRRIAREHGPLVRVPVPGKPFHLVSCPRLARQVLLTNSKNYGKSFDWRIVHSLLGDGLVTSHDEVWRHARAASAPGFKGDPFARLGPALAQVIEAEVAGWAPAGGALPTVAATTRLALRAFTGPVLGVEAEPQLETIARSVASALRHLDRRLAALVDLHAYLPTTSRLRFARAVRRLDAVLYGWIDPLLASDGRGAPGLLGLLARASAAGLPGGLEPRRWLRDQVLTFLLAGHETVAVSLTWCLWLLALHPEEQERLRAGLPGQGELSAWLEAWTPLDAAIHEVLRLYPPVWSLGREARGPDRLGEWEVPAGATVMVSPYAIQRSAAHWPEPDAFRPQRFAAGPPEQGEELTWLPFSAGPRRCPGDRLALLELKLALREVLLRYRVTPLQRGPVATEALISLRPRRELPLRLTPA